ncbi:WD40 repeat domain-containing protein [Nodosilinea sp. LEGE 07088]|uniref:WD40 repeat domain-containing protein n=1 Tax=Nodosilinea sp. LEGE 07088 TaxID=2777968 RepID=UPI00187EC361|nr:WD40 repeat domain-containing protein [Nodosilinea sp. LEGE 07088]MBE9140763.1 WD40 repeat domain-containing protein [Nodosilinea sp. LEGE 07088]
MSSAKPKFAKSWRCSLSDYVTALAWSPDGAWLGAATAAGEVGLGQESAAWRMLRLADGQAINALGFSADGEWLAVGGQSGEVLVWSVQSPESDPAWAQVYAGAWIDRLAWHPTQPQLAYAVGPQVQIWNIPKNEKIAELDFADSSVLHLAWHPTGSHLAASGHSGIKVWSAEHWADPHQAIAVPGASLHCAWSADGRYLGSGNLDRTLTVAEWNSPPPWLMQGFPGKVRQVAWSALNTPSGSPLIAAACIEGITVWERQGRGWQSRVLEHHRQRVNAIAFQPNSDLLAAVGQDGVVTLWEQGKTLLQTIKFPQEACSAVAWHPQDQSFTVAGSMGMMMTWQPAQSTKGFG